MIGKRTALKRLSFFRGVMNDVGAGALLRTMRASALRRRHLLLSRRAPSPSLQCTHEAALAEERGRPCHGLTTLPTALTT